jgi:hypothetical protein
MAKRPQSTEEILQQIVDEFKKIAEKARAEGRQPSEKAAGRAAQAQAELDKIRAEKEAALQITQAAKEIKKSTAETTKAARQSSAATKDNQKRAAQQSKDTTRLTEVVKKLSRNDGVATGTVKNIGGLIGGSIRQSTIGNMLNPRAFMGAALQSAGLEQIVPAVIGGGGGRSSATRVSNQQQKNDTKQLSIFESIEDTLKSILEFTKINNIILTDLAESWQANARERIEAAREAARVQEGGTAGAGAGQRDTSLGGIGAIIAGLAVALGTISGLFKAWIRTLETFAELFRLDKLAALFNEKVLVPIGEFFGGIASSIRGAASKAVDEVIAAFEIVKSKAGEITSRVATAIEEAIEAIKGGFKNLGIGEKFTATLNFFKEALGPLIRPFEEAAAFIGQMASADGVASKFSGIFKSIREFFNPVITLLEDAKGVIGTLLESVGRFSGLFKFVSTAVERLAWPLMVIMGVWDSVSGAIEGYKQEGFVGAVKGAITGLFNSIVGEPLNLLKDISSWLLKKMGFDNASKILDSFSFTDIFKKLVDAVFDPLSLLIDEIAKMFKSLPSKIIGMLPDSVRKFFGIEDTKEQTAQKALQSTTWGGMAEAGPAMPVAATDITSTDAMGASSGLTETTFTPVINKNAIAVATQSATNAVAASNPPPVNLGAGGQGMFRSPTLPPPSNPRSSGAVSTAPAPSLLDRTINSRAYYGMGHP